MYHGTSISNLIQLIKNRRNSSLYVTDTVERARRYANAQATGNVSKDYEALKAGTAVLRIITNENPNWMRRPESHDSLDSCEAVVKNFDFEVVEIKFHDYENTRYGNRRSGYLSQKEIMDLL